MASYLRATIPIALLVFLYLENTVCLTMSRVTWPRTYLSLSFHSMPILADNLEPNTCQRKGSGYNKTPSPRSMKFPSPQMLRFPRFPFPKFRMTITRWSQQSKWIVRWEKRKGEENQGDSSWVCWGERTKTDAIEKVNEGDTASTVSWKFFFCLRQASPPHDRIMEWRKDGKGCARTKCQGK